MKTTIFLSKHIFVRVIFLAISLTMFSCGGCGSWKVQKSMSTTLSDQIPDTGQLVMQVDTLAPSPDSENTTNTYKQPEVHIKRTYLGKDIDLVLNPEHRGGEAWSPVWEEEFQNNGRRRLNRIVQLSPSVILYRRFPKEVVKNFYYLDQPEKIEFMDSSYNTIKVVDVWKERPYQDMQNAKLTYWHFDFEGMGVITYTEQKTPVTPNEYSLFTHVHSEGNHVVVNYELRSIKNVKNFGVEGYSSDVVAVRHTLHIYDLRGNLKYELKDLPSVDQAVVSNDGRYMMYVFGGMGLATANSPFATIERSGWALMRLEDQQVVYQEYTDDGKLAFNRLWLEQNFLRIAYSVPNPKLELAHYHVFFNEEQGTIFKKQWSQKEWKNLTRDWANGESTDWKFYINKFEFDQISVSKK